MRRAANHLSLNDAQRGVLSVLLLILLIGCAIGYFRNSRTVPEPQQPFGERANELADKIDINSAEWSTLAVLPSIGEKRARDIVAYRQRVRDRDPSTIAFRRPEDLLKVDGIGYAMMQRLSPYLIFEAPTTAPTTATSR
jgi:DNA uptake protein ComE-like DNA-binding protein